MHYIKAFIITIFFSMACLPGAQAQTMDNDRMNRDIHIMDKVLRELFKTQWTGQGNTVHIRSGAFYFGDNDDIRGTYLSDYGVIFQIPRSTQFVSLESSAKTDTPGIQFQYGSNGDKKVTKESVISRMKEFLQNYGSTIGQLSNDDRITIIYNNNPSNHADFVRVLPSGSAKKPSDKKTIPTITVTAREADLQAFRKGSISKDQFDRRLKVSATDDANTHHQDVKVMAKILKTAFEDAGDDAFRVRGSVDHIYIDGLGALFYVDASYGGGFYNLAHGMKSLAKGIQVYGKKLSNVFKVDSLGQTTLTLPSSSDQSSKAEKRTRQEQEKAYHQFLTQLKQTLADYGRTLRSVKPDEQIYISVAFSAYGGDIPSRVDLQIKKSVLEDLDKGSISREQAMKQITVRKYGS